LLHNLSKTFNFQVQPFQKSQPPVQTVQPIQHQSHQQHNMHENQSNQHQNNPTSYVVNLTPEQLEQLKRFDLITNMLFFNYHIGTLGMVKSLLTDRRYSCKGLIKSRTTKNWVLKWNRWKNLVR